MLSSSKHEAVCVAKSSVDLPPARPLTLRQAQGEGLVLNSNPLGSLPSPGFTGPAGNDRFGLLRAMPFLRA